MILIHILLPSLLMLVTTIYANTPPPNKCSHPMAGLMKMSSGIDITKLDLFPSFLGATNDHHGFVANVLDYTCSGRQFLTRCSLSLNNTEALYDVPDQMRTINVPNDSSEEINFAQDMIDVKQLLMDRFGLADEEERIGAFSGNSKYMSLLKQFFELDKVFAEITLPVGAFEAINDIYVESAMYASGSPSEDFIQRAKKLPAKYEDNPAIYREFVQHFGTHYFQSAQFTYNGYVQFALNRTYVFDTEDLEIKDNMKQSYIDWFKRKQPMMMKPDAERLNDKLKKNGEIILAYGQDDSKWDDKVNGASYESKDLENFRTPVMSRAALKPMDNLISLIAENTTNSNLQSQVKIAIRMYRIEAYLAELKNVYNFSSDYYKLSDSEKVTLDKVEKHVNLQNIAQINETVKMIDELYNKTLLYKVKQFYDRILYDAYVTSYLKIQFAKEICSMFTCPDSDIVDVHDEIAKLYQEYTEIKGYEKLRQFVKKVLDLKGKLRIRSDLGIKCVFCLF